MSKKRVKIFLYGGDKAYADETTKSKRCECSALIYCVKTEKGKTILIHRTANGWIDHRACCPTSYKYNKQKKL